MTLPDPLLAPATGHSMAIAHDAHLSAVIDIFRAQPQLRVLTIVDAAGQPITTPVVPGSDIYLRPLSGARRVTVTASVPAAQNGFGGRVITGVAHDSSLTPVALAVPTPTVIDFELTF